MARTDSSVFQVLVKKFYCSDEVLISFQDIHKSFGPKVVLDGLNLDICKGETLTIMGGSGTGKSVTLKILIGLLTADNGKVYFDGELVSELSERELIRVRTRISMLFQGAALFDYMTVGENVGYPLQEHTNMTEKEIRDKVAEKLELVELPNTEHLYPAELSGGMKKRVGLARAIAIEPEVILYDEPTTGLDPITANTINQLIIRMQEVLRVTSVVVTHDLVSAYMVTDRIAMLYNGKIIKVGTVDEIKNSDNKIIRQFITGGMEGNE